MKRILVLGANGMLGHMVNDVLRKDDSLRVESTTRLGPEHYFAPPIDPRDRFDLKYLLRGMDYVINCIGIIKPRIDEFRGAEAIYVNGLFPHELAAEAEKAQCRVLQIATDCVYSGETGGYAEEVPHDARDVYGKTKSLGEAHGKYFHNLRCSILGPELKGHKSLHDWLLRQSRCAEVNGYINHRWNGITTLAFAKICHGIIKRDVHLPHLQHIVPGDSISKCDLLGLLATHNDRTDIKINRVHAPASCNRTLSTSDGTLNDALWDAAGYYDTPLINDMVKELAQR